MTRCDYKLAVKLIKESIASNELHSREDIINLFVAFFMADNPRFNRDQFRKACDE